ncbi:MAG: HAD-IIIC family phosphatase [Rhizobacter sp.]
MADFDQLLRIDSRPALRAALDAWRGVLTLPQAQQLGQHAASLAPVPHPLRVAVVHTYTSDLLDPWLTLQSALAGFDLQVHHAPYGLALQEARADSALVAHRPDLTLMLLRREDLHPDLAAPIVGLSDQQRVALRSECLLRLREIVGLFRAQPVGQLLLTLLPSLTPNSLGLYDAQSAASEGAWWSRFKVELTGWLREACPSTLFLDLDEVAMQVGRAQFFDRRYWLSAKFPFAPQAANELARQVVAVGTVLHAPRAKVLVLDADNTLWGGVIGEDGIDGIALGPDYPGNAYVAFQRRILDLQQRGFILAMCSKNNPADVDQVLREHPHQVLREAHFAARRVNWEPKPDNLKSLAKELNLGLDSFIFVDDSDHECAIVRHSLPEVEVIQVPSRAVDVMSCLDRVARLEVLSLTDEDLAKTAMYAQERQRRELLDQAGVGGSLDGSYLARLQMKMRVAFDERAHLARLSQLTRKTNQFNLTTRRYDEEQVLGFIDRDDCLVADFTLGDVFGDSGIVGLAIWRLTAPDRAELDTFLMSCRVIGREAEAAFLHATLRQLAARGVTCVVADYLPTPKNVLVREFLPKQGFAPTEDGRFARDLLASPAQAAEDFPIAVAVLDHPDAITGAVA